MDIAGSKWSLLVCSTVLRRLFLKKTNESFAVRSPARTLAPYSESYKSSFDLKPS